MAIVRVAALKDFRATSVTTCQPGTAFDIGALGSTQFLVGFLHLTCSTFVTRPFVATIQCASSSGFLNVTTTAMTFGISTAIGSTWPAPVAVSTDKRYFRSKIWLSTAASTDGSWKGLMGMGIQ